MKTVVMTTDLPKMKIIMGGIKFETGKPQEVDEILADALLNRKFPKFELVGEASCLPNNTDESNGRQNAAPTEAKRKKSKQGGKK